SFYFDKLSVRILEHRFKAVVSNMGCDCHTTITIRPYRLPAAQMVARGERGFDENEDMFAGGGGDCLLVASSERGIADGRRRYRYLSGIAGLGGEVCAAGRRPGQLS